MDSTVLGKILVGVGISMVLSGGLLLLFSRLPVFKNFGNLPGDIRIQNGNFTCVAPLVSILLLSLLLTILANIIARVLSR